jgi:hypothetical protein
MRAMILVLAVVACGICASVNQAEEVEKLTPDKIPEKVMATLKARLPGCEITKAERVIEGGELIYDIEMTQQGRKWEMDLKDDGTAINIEKEVDLKDFPAAAKKLLEAMHPKATIAVIMQVSNVKGKEEKPEHYEVTLTLPDKTEHEVLLTLDGAIFLEPKPAAAAPEKK